MNRRPSGIWPVGSIIDDPEAVLLVQLGAAEPADEECEAAHGMSDEQLNAVRRAYKRTAAGIAPEDFQRFDAGEILGYDADGNDIPGPNAPENLIPQEYDERNEWTLSIDAGI